jgi:predicted DNA-binding WGR domain protein
MHRFYRLDVQPDLFGQWYLMREWGRIGNAGRGEDDSLPYPAAGPRCAKRAAPGEERRGYLTI